MKRRTAAITIIAAFVMTGNANAQMADKASQDRVHSHVAFMADDLLEGRETGERGYNIAALYVANQFRALGFQPGGEKGSWYQQVPFRKAKPVAGKTKISFHGGKGEQGLTAKDVTIFPSFTDRQRSLSAGLVFAGHGLTDAAVGLDDYRGINAKGKIVVVLQGVPKGLDTDVAAHLGGAKAEIAAAHGAIGMIEIPTRAPDPKRPFNASGKDGPEITDWVDAKGKSGSTPAGMKLFLRVSPDMAKTLFDGAKSSLKSVITAAGKRKRVAGFALPGSFTVQSESEWTDFTSPEIIALLPGSDPVLSKEYVVMMGHLDHLGLKSDAKPGEDNVYNGALDNAAGVATLLEAARHWADSGKAPKRSVLFVVHTGEEIGLLGADYFATHPTVPIQSIVGGVDLDMPVPLYPFTDVVAFGGGHSTIGKAVEEAAQQMGIAVSPDPMPEQAIFTRSDHYMFVRKGVPSILLFTGYANGGKAKWDDFFGNRYHSVKDDLDQPIQWDAAARYAEYNYRIARILADAPDRPKWIEGNYFGDRFDPKGPRAPANPAKESR